MQTVSLSRQSGTVPNFPHNDKAHPTAKSATADKVPVPVELVVTTRNCLQFYQYYPKHRWAAGCIRAHTRSNATTIYGREYYRSFVAYG